MGELSPRNGVMAVGSVHLRQLAACDQMPSP
jgi:hypothetical protein